MDDKISEQNSKGYENDHQITKSDINDLGADSIEIVNTGTGNCVHDNSLENNNEAVILINSKCPENTINVLNPDFQSSDNEAQENTVTHDESFQNEDMCKDESRGEIGSNISIVCSYLEEQSKDVFISWITKLSEERELLKKNNEDFQNEIDSLRDFKMNSIKNTGTQVEELEKKLAQSEADIFVCKREMENEHTRLTNERIIIREDLTSRLQRITKQYESENKEKESMVVKYAMAEKKVLVIKKREENIEKKLKDVEKDKELLQGKVKALSLERSRICSSLDNKIQENGVATRSIDRMKDEINAKDVKIKWGQMKQKSEIEAHKETQVKLDRTLAKICNHEEEVRSISEEAEKVVRESRDGEFTRANVLDKQLREHKASLIMDRQKLEDVSILYKQIKSEQEILRSVHSLLETEATTLRVKVSKYESTKIESEKLVKSLRSEMKATQERADDLSRQLSNAAIYAEQIQSEKFRADFAERKNAELLVKVSELKLEASNCRETQAELLSFTQKLTDKNVFLQNQLTSFQGKNKLFEMELEEIKSESTQLRMCNRKLEKCLQITTESKEVFEQSLSSLADEKRVEISRLNTKVSDLSNELQVQRKKHQNTFKDTNREVQKLRRKLELAEQSCPENQQQLAPVDEQQQQQSENSSSPSLCPSHESASRTSSNTSLNTMENQDVSNHCPSRKSPTSPIYDMPQQVLIERILKLQRETIRRCEKLDFLEEHIVQLLEELQRKNKIIHHYIMNERPGALINSKSDNAKSSNSNIEMKLVQAEIMKRGGIMATVYGSHTKDESMTLDLSLEINRKLQAIVEDTLLKNITLKSNLNTLGDEVAKLANDRSIRD